MVLERQHSDITLVILAGGKGRRMGSPKSDLEIAGKPILTYLLERFAWEGPTLLITAPGQKLPAAAADFIRHAVDAIADQGPLQGMLAAIEVATSPWLVITTLDMPGLTQKQLQWVVARLAAQPDLLGLMLHRTVGGKRQIEPFPFACRLQARDAIASHLTSGKRSIHSLAAVQGFAVEAAPDDWADATWTNLNTPTDYQKFTQTLQS